MKILSGLIKKIDPITFLVIVIFIVSSSIAVNGVLQLAEQIEQGNKQRLEKEEIRGREICVPFCESHGGLSHTYSILFINTCVCKDGTETKY